MRCKLLTLFVLVASSSSTMAQSNTGKGAALGGVAGAVVGGIIGHQNDETPEGALIGGAVGAIAGGVIGHNRDEQIAREQRYQQQMARQQYQQQQQYHVAEQTRRAVSVSDVITMTRSGIGEGVIVSHIEANGVQRRPEVSDVITMHQQGVSEYVISSMQRAAVAGTTYSYPAKPTYTTTRTYSAPTYHQAPIYHQAPTYTPGTVIIHEHVSVPPTYVVPSTPYPQRSHYHPTYSYPRRGF